MPIECFNLLCGCFVEAYIPEEGGKPEDAKIISECLLHRQEGSF